MGISPLFTVYFDTKETAEKKPDLGGKSGYPNGRTAHLYACSCNCCETGACVQQLPALRGLSLAAFLALFGSLGGLALEFLKACFAGGLILAAAFTQPLPPCFAGRGFGCSLLP